MSSKPVPIVAIVGRANVGKSSLFNAAIGRREAIVAREPGTTRDNVTAKASWAGKDFWLVDTAGLKSAEDDFELGIQEQITSAAADADVIAVVTEADVPFTAEDRKVADMALKSKKPVVLVVNKIDKNRRAERSAFAGLGIKQVVTTCATQKSGIDDMLDALAGLIPKRSIKKQEKLIKLGILGRPNVGKSSLFNALAKKQQALVSSRAGTTRDVNRVTVRYQGYGIELMDTAGIRRSGRIEQGVEKFSILRSLAAIEESDICLLVMDAGELNVQLDQKIAGLIKEAGRGLILVVSKYDTLDKEAADRSAISSRLAHDFSFTPWAPLVFTSALTGDNVAKIFELALDIHTHRQIRLATPELNRWLRQTVESHTPAGLKGRMPKLNYIVQEDDQPLPSFKVFGSQTKFLHWSYKRYMERKFREKWPLPGTPIKLWFIEKAKKD